MSRRNEDNLLKKSSPARGTLMVFKERLHFYAIGIILLIAEEVFVPLRLFVCRAFL